jgi:predicted 2-oxoglutarate/Fe(II)-dependent dioxygenase YbiX
MTYEEQIRHDFETKKYAHLTGLLDPTNCVELTNELKKLVAEGKTVKDTQCPLSQAIHGAPVFDSLLEQLTPHFELASGKKLYPTYAYARLYAPGDELKIHTDRPACEISATLTLGFEGDVWPIFVGDYTNDKKEGEKVTTESGDTKYITNKRKIVMDVGDAILYRGMEKVHWRKKYKQGKWQAQVFLHYVDAEGPHAEWKYDKRPCLNHHVKQEDFTYFVIEDALSRDACQKIIDSVEKQAEGEEARIGGGGPGVIDKTIRDVKKVNLPTYKGIGATMAGIGMAANKKAWNFDLSYANQCDYLKYDKEGHYKAHVDTFMNPGDPETRKLTILVFLNDDFEGGRLFIQTGDQRIYPPQKPGTALIFPSYQLHGVEPVTSGIRRSIVTWLVGPWFK